MAENTQPVPGNQTVEDQLTDIREKLDEIEKKISDKWFLPIFVTVLTALASANFFVTRHFTAKDICQK